MRRFLFLALFVLGACTSQTESTPVPSPIALTGYSTSTPRVAPSGLEAMVTAGIPLPSPTPFTYTVQAGDTMGGIALKFGVSVDDLQAANPEISPNTMSIGQVLRIPSDPANPSGEPTPTPVDFDVEQVHCYPVADGGMWCLVLAHNPSSDFIENVSAQVTLVDAGGASLASQPALLPLNILPPGASLPLAVFFPPVIPMDARPQVQILTAIRLLPGDSRYLPASTDNVLAQVDWNGLEAQVSGVVVLPAESKTAATVWVAATAYDELNQVVGMRRWEGGGLQAGGSLPFTMLVASLAGRIDRVELAVEARP